MKNKKYENLTPEAKEEYDYYINSIPNFLKLEDMTEQTFINELYYYVLPYKTIGNYKK